MIAIFRKVSEGDQAKKSNNGVMEKNNFKERRQAKRKESINLIFYMSLSPKNITEGMGKTLNLSKKGALIEIVNKIEPSTPIEMDIAIKEKIFHLKGKVVWMRQKSKDSYQVGIEFETPQDFPI